MSYDIFEKLEEKEKKYNCSSTLILLLYLEKWPGLFSGQRNVGQMAQKEKSRCIFT